MTEMEEVIEAMEGTKIHCECSKCGSEVVIIWRSDGLTDTEIQAEVANAVCWECMEDK